MSSHDKKKPVESYFSRDIQGSVSVPGDKSISHRAVILGGIASKETRITGLLESDDIFNAIKSMSYLGASFEKIGLEWIVRGVGNGCLLAPEKPLYFGNSGTGCNLIMGIAGVYDFRAVFQGDESLSKRPMRRVLDPLCMMGVQVEPVDSNYLPLALHGPKNPNPIFYNMPIASSQVKSAILLASLNTPGITSIVEDVKTRDHTERMLREFGVDLLIQYSASGKRSIHLEGRCNISGCNLNVPGDFSSAAFLLAAALLIPGSNLQILNVGINPSRIGLIDTLQEMGADISILNPRVDSSEDISDIQVRFSKLRGIFIPENRVPFMIDEYPILAVIAAFAKGKTTMKGLRELRFKESDRLSAIVEGLKINNVDCEAGEDYLVIRGSPGGRGIGSRIGHMVKTRFDHRIAMSFIVMGLASEYPVIVDDYSMISTSFPNFIELMQGLGARIKIKTEK
ncbi:3-phosphoshikimate 1-carboxyvinyltransferase [Candidatus Liberibacter americanus]|uniref:3-phosphoshikimate 1-carboxyvinyltransferase n=1 Tax=Candidatus Liberibacter americanus str. Sao Paulo TaxID=1261131 RepID=U6B4A5_9HYPH|nr:3-phosphoshikimate 1-carboxyvinyltransferase [Candidatus Liberibacter americanus]AHA27468.1 5-enolpyruvylshikimate-3-phosphate synthase [Candidatus Liberibacter americanus str. Sao Paulo]EMS36571.1 3-phosphoshikimate 1-carboxyvinyltransferase [Candidatus Liberibacter americanus PW_SP]